jgi:hypothetical protein
MDEILRRPEAVRRPKPSAADSNAPMKPGSVHPFQEMARVKAMEWICRNSHNQPTYRQGRKRIIQEMAQMVRKVDRRKQKRHSADAALSILLTDGEGRESVAHAHLLNISVSGASLRVSQKIPIHSIVSFFHHALGIGGRGTVRHCTSTRNGYILGLEFPNGTGWSEPLPHADFPGFVAETSPHAQVAPPLPLSRPDPSKP